MPSRRELLRGSAGIALGALAVPLLQACGGGSNNAANPGTTPQPSSGGSTPASSPSPGVTSAPATPSAKPVSGKIQFTWWGGADRAKYTQQIAKDYQSSHSGTTIQTSFTDWGSYWQKMATQAAGKNLPDALQMSTGYVAQYGTAGTLLDLGAYKSALNLGDTDVGMLNAGTVGGKLYGLGTGGSMLAMNYNKTVVDSVGVPVPADGFTHDSFSAWAKKVQPKLPKNMWVADGYPANIFATYIRQHIDEMYTSDGKVAFTKQLVLDWMNYWFELQRAGVLIPPAKAANASSGNASDDPFSLGMTVVTFQATNSFSVYADQMKKQYQIALSRIPTGGKQSGDQVVPPMLWSAASNTKNLDLTLSLLSYLLHDPDAIKLTGLDRGVPGNPEARQVLEPTLSASDKATVQFINKYGPTSRPAPAGYVAASYDGELHDALSSATEAIGLGKATTAEAADSFWTAVGKMEAKAS